VSFVRMDKEKKNTLGRIEFAGISGKEEF